MGRIIRNGIEYGSGGSASNVVYLSQEAYDALPDDKLTDGVEYRITDANTDSTKARNIAYDNAESGLEATSVQGAIDAVNESLNGLIKSKTITGTTTASGNLPLIGDMISDIECIINVIPHTKYQSLSLMGIVSEGSINFRTTADLTKAANTSVTATIYYIAK